MQPAPALPVRPSEPSAPAGNNCPRTRGGVSCAGQVCNFKEGEKGEETIEAPDQDVQPQKSIHTPIMPTQADMPHYRDNGHLPYWDWCPDCVEGFGR